MRNNRGASPGSNPNHAPKAPVALDEYFKTTRVRGLSFSYDEKLVVTLSDAGGRPDLWVEPIGGGPATYRPVPHGLRRR